MSSALRVDSHLDAPLRPQPIRHFMSKHAAVRFCNQTTAPEQPETLHDPKLASGIKIKIVNGAGLPAGVNALLEQLRSFETLAENWDSYGGATHNSLVQAPIVNLIIVGHASRMKLPRLVPHPSGGVSAIWRLGRKELDVLVLPDQQCEISVEDLDTGDVIGPDHVVSQDEANKLVSMFCLQN